MAAESESEKPVKKDLAKNKKGSIGPDAWVELRSDVKQSPWRSLGSGKRLINENRMIGIVAGAIFVAVIIGIGVLTTLNPDFVRRITSGGVGAGVLPNIAGRPASLVSGLSGVACEHPDRRPIAVMLAGDPINRPISGFTKADMVWELPVLVSNVTRLMAVYQCGEPTDIGSVRSARHDYLFVAEGMNAILAHWGGSFHALNRISAGEFDTINALTNPFNSFFRKNNLPPPYNGFTTYDRLWNALQELGYETESKLKGYNFKDDGPADQRPSGGTLTVAWPGAFQVHYEYNPETNRYERYWAGVKQVDAEDQQVVAPSAVIIMRAPNDFADGPGGYNDVGVEGSGNIEVYQDGKVIKGTWRKSKVERSDPVHFSDENGKPLVFTRGQLWAMVPDESIEVTWEENQEQAQAFDQTTGDGTGS